MKLDVTITQVCRSGGTRCRALSPWRPPRLQRQRPPAVAMVCKESAELWCIDSYDHRVVVGDRERCHGDMGRAINKARQLFRFVDDVSEGWEAFSE